MNLGFRWLRGLSAIAESAAGATAPVDPSLTILEAKILDFCQHPRTLAQVREAIDSPDTTATVQRLRDRGYLKTSWEPIGELNILHYRRQ